MGGVGSGRIESRWAAEAAQTGLARRVDPCTCAFLRGQSSCADKIPLRCVCLPVEPDKQKGNDSERWPAAARWAEDSRSGQARESMEGKATEGPHEAWAGWAGWAFWAPGQSWAGSAGWAFLGTRVTSRQGPLGPTDRQDLCCKYQALALTWRLLAALGDAWRALARLGIPWRRSRAVRYRAQTRPLPYRRVPRAARGVKRAANQGGSAGEPRLPRLCQALRQCYCHEGEGVIKTERPAVLLKSSVDRFSPLHHRRRALRRQFALASWAGFSLLRLPDRVFATLAWRPLTPVQHRQSF